MKQRYLIIQDRPRVSGLVVLVYFVILILLILFWSGFFYLGVAPLESEVFEMQQRTSLSRTEFLKTDC